MRGFLGLVGIALLGSPLAAETTDAITVKVQALTHPRYAEREKAARDLEAIGEPALKALREVAQSKDEELRARAAGVAVRIENTLRSQRLLEAPKLALKFDKTPLDKAVTEFAAKAQRRVILDKAAVKNPDRTVTLTTGEIPYWQAVEAFYRAAGLVEDDEPFAAPPPGSPPNPGPRAIRRLAGAGVTNAIRLIDGEPAGTVAAERAFRVRALQPGFGQNRYDDVKGEVTLHLDVDPAPGLAIREILGVEVRKATAGDGRELAAAYSSPEVRTGLEQDTQLLMQQALVLSGDFAFDTLGSLGHTQAVTLKTGGLRPRALAELQGVVVARVITPPEPVVRLSRLLEQGPREATAGGTTIQVRELTAGPNNRVTATVRVTYQTDLEESVVNLPIQMKGRVQQFIRINRPSRIGPAGVTDLKVVNATGAAIRGLTARVTKSSSDGITLVQDVTVTFEKPPEGAESIGLVLMGKRPAVVEMPFVLKNVPLP